MSRFPEMRYAQFARFLEAFSRPGTLPPPLVEAVAKDLDVSYKEFLKWYGE